MNIEQIVKWLSGRKTYIVAGMIVVLGFLQGMEIFVLPEAAWAVLAALGLTTLRAGVNKVAKTVEKK